MFRCCADIEVLAARCLTLSAWLAGLSPMLFLVSRVRQPRSSVGTDTRTMRACITGTGTADLADAAITSGAVARRQPICHGLLPQVIDFVAY